MANCIYLVRLEHAVVHSCYRIICVFLPSPLRVHVVGIAHTMGRSQLIIHVYVMNPRLLGVIIAILFGKHVNSPATPALTSALLYNLPCEYDQIGCYKLSKRSKPKVLAIIIVHVVATSVVLHVPYMYPADTYIVVFVVRLASCDNERLSKHFNATDIQISLFGSIYRYLT